MSETLGTTTNQINKLSELTGAIVTLCDSTVLLTRGGRTETYELRSFTHGQVLAELIVEAVARQ